jgi:hypothetical protein
MHDAILQPGRRRLIHAYELPDILAVGDDGIRERLITAERQRSAQVDPIAPMRGPRTRGAGTQHESSKKNISEHGGELSLYRRVTGTGLMHAQHA